MTKPKEDAVTPMMRHFYQVKSQYPDALIFYRMGDFFEMFDEDAVIGSKKMEVALTSRSKNQKNQIPMCGVPVHAYEQYLNKLTRAGFKVAICDQVEDPSLAKGLVKREVTRVVTPGTVTSSEILEDRSNHFICVLCPDQHYKILGAAFCDFSTGEFELGEIEIKDGLNGLLELVYLYRPAEVLFPKSRSEKPSQKHTEFVNNIKQLLNQIPKPPFITPQEYYLFDQANSTRLLQEHFTVGSLAGFGIEEMSLGISAGGAALGYLKENQKDSLRHIRKIRPLRHQGRMMLDDSTLRNLEIFETFDQSRHQHSLIHHLDRTKTAMGGRLIRKWFGSPLTDQVLIEDRLESVGFLSDNPNLLERIRGLLAKVGDMERIAARIALPLTHLKDLVLLRQSLEPLKELAECFLKIDSQNLIHRTKDFDPLEDLFELLTDQIVEELPAKTAEGGFIRTGIDSELDHLRDLMKNSKQLIARIEAEEKKKTGIGSLKIKYNKVFGFYIEVSNASKHLVPESYIRRQTLVNNERYITEELKEIEESILTAQDKALVIETRLFREIRNSLQEQLNRIQKTARTLAEVDVLSCFAFIAKMNGYNCPQFAVSKEKQKLALKQSRHPVVETIQLDEPFIPNDCELDSQSEYCMVITGPNMGGKSTYMRQVALIALMAQTGCFVPAASAELPVFDRIFTRVGASDNLTRGQSTFMVEMSEAASILNNATEKSLIVLDEIGRGTSTFDGISLAWSIIEFLHQIKSLTLFATHYHELVLLEETHPGVKNAKVAVREEKENIVFLRKVIPGQADKSYGIQVARLAGLPAKVINRAKELLGELESAEKQLGKNEANRSGVFVPKKQGSKNEQTSFLPPVEPWVEELKNFDIDNITPLQALSLLSEIQKKIVD